MNTHAYHIIYEGNCSNAKCRTLNPLSCCMHFGGIRRDGKRNKFKCGCDCNFKEYDGEGSICTIICFIFVIIIFFPIFLLYLICCKKLFFHLVATQVLHN